MKGLVDPIKISCIISFADKDSHKDWKNSLCPLQEEKILTMAEKHVGKLHMMKAEAKEKWGELKETGVKESMVKNVEMLRSKVIRGVNAGEDYDHHYRRKSRFVQLCLEGDNIFSILMLLGRSCSKFQLQSWA